MPACFCQAIAKVQSLFVQSIIVNVSPYTTLDDLPQNAKTENSASSHQVHRRYFAQYGRKFSGKCLDYLLDQLLD